MIEYYKEFENEHIDLEEREYISTNVEFDTESTSFSGLPDIDIEIKTKQAPQTIEKRENARRRKHNELF